MNGISKDPSQTNYVIMHEIDEFVNANEAK